MVGASCITLFGAVSDPWLHLKYATATLGSVFNFPVLRFTWGPLYWFHVGYSFISYFLGTGMLLFFMLSTNRVFRKNLLLMLAGSAIPWINYMCYLVDIRIPGIDTTPFGLFVAVIFFGTALFSTKILESMPIARSAIFEIISDAVLVVDGLGRVTDFNRAAAALFPCLMHRTQEGENLRKILSVRDQNEFETEMDVEGEIRRYSCRVTEYKNLKKRDAVPGKIILFKDITESIKLLRQVQELAASDCLTGLFNRRHFFDLAEKTISYLRRTRLPDRTVGEPLAFLIADLDLFKHFNDTYGHPTGDEIIKAAAGAIRESIRLSDIAARFGGEEFVCLMPSTRVDEAYIVAERIRSKVENLTIPLNAGESSSGEPRRERITISVGVSGVRGIEEGFTLSQLISAADKALYASKQSGRNRTTIG